MTLEHLAKPPINEVVCGFAFEPIRTLDPVILGTYWEQRKADFPNRSIHPPLTEEPSFFLGAVGPVRVWFVAKNEVFLIQIQPDRFYMNWRKREAAYPRFSDTESEPGILKRAMKEFGSFSDFCKKTLGVEPVATSIDLAKIDHLQNGAHWSDFDELARLVPWLEPFSMFSKTQTPAVSLRFTESRDKGNLFVSLDTAMIPMEGEGSLPIVRLETRMSKVRSDKPEDAFRWSNEQLNDVFDAMIPREQRDRKFQ